MCRRTKITRGFNNFMQMSVLDKNKKFNQPYFGKKQLLTLKMTMNRLNGNWFGVYIKKSECFIICYG